MGLGMPFLKLAVDCFEPFIAEFVEVFQFFHHENHFGIFMSAECEVVVVNDGTGDLAITAIEKRNKHALRILPMVLTATTSPKPIVLMSSKQYQIAVPKELNAGSMLKIR